jgi:5-methylcytosine-specific restriction protein A
MPSALKKRCGYRGCPRTTHGRYCDEHLPLARQFYDRRRGSTKERGYDADWQCVAEQRRGLDAYLCQWCLKEGLLRGSPLVDHIIPIHVRPDWRLEIGNTQVLCFDCHTIKTSEDMQRYGGRANKNLRPDQIKNRHAAMMLIATPRHDEPEAF